VQARVKAPVDIPAAAPSQTEQDELAAALEEMEEEQTREKKVAR
jgi:hypothetical protein